MRIVFTLILSTIFFVSAYAALPAAPDILYHPLRTDVTTGGTASDDVFVACAANEYDALEPDADQNTNPGKWKNYDETTNKYKKNCVTCSRASFLTQYKKIINSGNWQKDQCCRASENVVCQEMLRAYKAGCTKTGASTAADGDSAPTTVDQSTGYGKDAICIA
jgi:hypothetical protein